MDTGANLRTSRAEGGGRRAEGGGQRAEGGGRRAEGGGRSAEGGGQRAERRGRSAEGGGQRQRRSGPCCALRSALRPPRSALCPSAFKRNRSNEFRVGPADNADGQSLPPHRRGARLRSADGSRARAG